MKKKNMKRQEKQKLRGDEITENMRIKRIEE